MFWFTKSANENKKKTDKRQIEGTKPNKSETKTSAGSGDQKSVERKGQRPDSAQIRAQALANAKLARAAIGEESLQKIAAAIRKKQASDLERAKERVKQTDPERVAEEILNMLDE